MSLLMRSFYWSLTGEKYDRRDIVNIRILCSLLLVVCFVLVIPRVVFAEGVGFQMPSMQGTVTVDGENINAREHRVEVKQGAHIRVELIAAGGTGYEWQLTNEELQATEVSDKTSEPMKVESNRVGGPIQTVFIIKVKENARGEEKMVFKLVRPWEEQGKEAKVFELTVQVL
jgi:predicted secreted protein